jgi:CheY-like chemotaxis protein
LVGALDGIQTAERIRVRYGIPIVFMTGYDIGDIQEKTRHITNVAHIEKPVGISTLAQVIEATLASATA